MQRVAGITRPMLAVMPLLWVQVSQEIPEFVETEVAGIRLSDQASAETLLGPSPVPDQEEFGFGYYRFTNTSGSELLTLVVHPGGHRLEIGEFHVGAPPDEHSFPVFPGADTFSTGKGIRLGMLQSELVGILGEPHRKKGSQLAYHLEGESAFLRRYNMPSYRATYVFEGEFLKEFSFGFDYP